MTMRPGWRCCVQDYLAVRATRIRPGLDDKVLADWNGLMIAALVNSAIILDEPDWLDDGPARF